MCITPMGLTAAAAGHIRLPRPLRRTARPPPRLRDTRRRGRLRSSSFQDSRPSWSRLRRKRRPPRLKRASARLAGAGAAVSDRGAASPPALGAAQWSAPSARARAASSGSSAGLRPMLVA
eukprot:CAMPEP_0175356306 /NCGR_PEP_ID=MMETSP0095-20121207/13910_1 /TAXON_ID=311494 /ORGANISM="Alexandrium monilatum, Strain CCMP3105" /LENGTH=119 /DNA_ID=CAMNT_0016653991 /DNA_START=109 /DNA_END=468 /DNA_ORIENTATION=-